MADDSRTSLDSLPTEIRTRILTDAFKAKFEMLSTLISVSTSSLQDWIMEQETIFKLNGSNVCQPLLFSWMRARLIWLLADLKELARFNKFERNLRMKLRTLIKKAKVLRKKSEGTARGKASAGIADINSVLGPILEGFEVLMLSANRCKSALELEGLPNSWFMQLDRVSELARNLELIIPSALKSIQDMRSRSQYGSSGELTSTSEEDAVQEGVPW